LKTVRASNDDIKHAVKGAKILIAHVMFTKHAMTQKQKKHIAQFEDMIKDSMPHCLEAGGEFFPQIIHITILILQLLSKNL
jgi:hypothetical protein